MSNECEVREGAKKGTAVCVRCMPSSVGVSMCAVCMMVQWMHRWLVSMAFMGD